MRIDGEFDMSKPNKAVEKLTPITNLIRFHKDNLVTAQWLRMTSIETLEKDTIIRLEQLEKLI